MIKLSLNGTDIPFQHFQFPALEQHIRINEGAFVDAVHIGCNNAQITVKYSGDEDLFGMMLLADAVRRLHLKIAEDEAELFLSLNIPYLPHARQDRVANAGEPLSIKVVADLINSQNFDVVYCADPHSDVASALIKNISIRTMTDIVGDLVERFDIPEIDNTILVAPDAGALKKVRDAAEVFGFKRVVCAEKVRNTETGEITGTRVNFSDHVGNKNFLILDDICDGGRTFIELAKVLRPLTDGKINLCVSHGIFSKGADVFVGIIDQVFTDNLIGEPHSIIEEINL